MGAESFSDAGVYRLRADLLIVQSLDFFPPLVDDPFTYGQIAATNSISDIYAMGARPVTALNIVGFPDDQLPLAILAEILRGGAAQVQSAGAVISGGHTVRDVEIKYGLSVTGIVEPERLLTNSAARPGDVLLLTKPLGTGFVTTAFKAGHCPEGVLAAAVASMTQLNEIGRDVAHAVGARAATDITGFGLAGHANEMAQASGVSVALDVAAFPLLPGVIELAQAGNQTRASASNRGFVEPILRIEGRPDATLLETAFDAQTSGGLLLAVSSERAGQAIERLREGGASAAARVGEVLPRGEKSLILRG